MRFYLLSFIYIIAVSFQVSGALLLLIYNISTKRENIIKNFANNKGFIGRCGTEITYNKDGLKEIFKIAYINKISFFYIIIGYIIGVFGKIEENTYIISIIVGMIIFIFIFICFGIYIPKQIISSKEKKDAAFFDITNEDIESLNINDTLDSPTDEDIQNMLDDIFVENK